MQDYLSVICDTNKGWKDGQNIPHRSISKCSVFYYVKKGSGTREVFDRVTTQAGIHIIPVWEAMSTTALINATINGLGISVLPNRMIIPSLKQGLISTVNVQDLIFSRNFYIIYHKDNF